MASPEQRESSSDECSVGCGDLGYVSPEELAEADLASVFKQAAQHLPNLVHIMSTEELLYLYARYKQVKVGKCKTSKPGFFDFEGKQKWEAWKALGDYNPQQAMQEYIDAVKKLDPTWAPKEPEETLSMPRSCIGPVVSCLYKMQEILREEDKDLFDHCRENNISRVAEALASGAIDVNITDDEGRGLLHWSCDRGRIQLVSLLLFHNVDINMKDDEGQTALHYASACEFLDIVDMLLDHGADPTLVDNDGFQPHQVTDNKEISEMLQHHAMYGNHQKPLSLNLDLPQ